MVVKQLLGGFQTVVIKRVQPFIDHIFRGAEDDAVRAMRDFIGIGINIFTHIESDALIDGENKKNEGRGKNKQITGETSK